MHPRQPTARADEVLARFFAEARRGAGGRRLDRLRRAEDDLRECLEALAPFLLPPHELALVALERQFGGGSATARVASARAVAEALPVYLDDPRWHGDDLEDRRLRIRLAEPLAEAVLRTSREDRRRVGIVVEQVEAAVRHAVFSLRQEREAARRA